MQKPDKKEYIIRNENNLVHPHRSFFCPMLAHSLDIRRYKLHNQNIDLHRRQKSGLVFAPCPLQNATLEGFFVLHWSSIKEYNHQKEGMRANPYISSGTNSYFKPIFEELNV